VQAQVLTSAKGMKYQFLKDVPGTAGKLGDVVKFHIIIESADGTVLQNSQMMSIEPQVDQVKEAQYSWSYEEMFTLANAGDSMAVFVPSDSIFAPKFGQQRPPAIAEHSDIKFVFKIVQFLPMAEFELEMKAKSLALQSEQESTIDALIKNKNLVAKKTPTGLFYVKKTAGKGLSPKAGDKVKVHYTGRLIDSTKFDSSVDRGTPFEFELGAHQVIAGWDEGLAMMKKGEKGILFIPSSLGYGERGAGGDIGPNSILIFDVELVDFESKNPQPAPAKKATATTKKPTVNAKKAVQKPSAKPVTTKKTQLK
jgi:peptidylprolyl isomerase